MKLGESIGICILPILAVSTFIGSSVYADTPSDPDIKVCVNQKMISFSHSPVIVKGTTLVPLRNIFEALGSTVEWDPLSQTVTATKNDKTIQLTVGKSVASINDRSFSLSVPTMDLNGTTMVPARFVSESLGANVSWNVDTRTISIDLPKAEVSFQKPAENTSVFDLSQTGQDGINHTQGGTDILGDPITKPEDLYAFAFKYNPSFPRDLADWYINLGRLYHIRGDIAFIQMCKETNFYRFGGDVKPIQNNFAGIGATGNGASGYQFSSIVDGVKAHLQHLYAYACKAPLPQSDTIVDPRFQFVKRGIAPTWEDLGGRWAISKQYGVEIVSLYERLANSIRTNVG